MTWNPYDAARYVAEMQRRLEEAAARLREAARREEQLEAAIAQRERRIRAVTEKVEALHREREDLATRAVALEREVERLRARLAELERAAARAEERAALAEARVGELATALERAGGEGEAGREAAACADEAERYLEAARRYKADLDNVRRHVAEEVARARREERVERLRGLARVHDALRRSVEEAPDPSSPYVEGNRALAREVEAEMRRAGAEPVGRRGERFDPALHEAVATEPGAPEDEVVRVVQLGWRLDDGALVRPARVVVGAGPGEDE